MVLLTLSVAAHAQTSGNGKALNIAGTTLGSSATREPLTDTTGIWVDQNAPAGGDGTFRHPFQTIQAGLNQANTAGNTDMRVTIRAGTYHERIKQRGDWKNKCGTKGNPFIIRGMPGERVIISGMKPINQATCGSPWALDSGSIYKINLGVWNPPTADVKNVIPDSFFMGMSERLMAQSPNPGTACWISQTTTTTATTTTITDTQHLKGVGDLTGGHCQFFGAGLSIKGATILSNDPVAGTLTYSGTSQNTGAQRNPYIIKNRLQLLDQPGEWCVLPAANGTTYDLYYWPMNAAEATNLLSANPSSQARDSYGSTIAAITACDMVYLYSCSYINLQGLEIVGAAANGNGVHIENSNNINISWNVIHDNCGALTGSNTSISGNAGIGVYFRNCSNTTLSNNYIALNFANVVMNSCTNCVITQNDLDAPYNDGMDIYSTKGTQPCLNNTISSNYIHHTYNLFTHADGIQFYDDGVRGLQVLNNLILDAPQNCVNGLEAATFQGNVLWPADIHNLGCGPISSNRMYYKNNTVNNQSFLNHKPFQASQNVSQARWQWCSATDKTPGYTGDYNFVLPTIYTATTWDPNDIANCTTWKTYGYLNSNGGVAALYAKTGQEQHSVIADPTTYTYGFVSMPTTCRGVDTSPAGMDYFTTNSKFTTLRLSGSGTNVLGDMVVGDHIEFTTDGVMRTITATSVANQTITFTPALYGYTVGDGLGWPTLYRNAYVENWKTRTSFVRNSNLAPGSPGLTMGPTGGPVGSLLSILNYQMGDFDGDGKRDLPVVPADVQANVQRHNWFLSPWCSFGN